VPKFKEVPLANVSINPYNIVGDHTREQQGGRTPSLCSPLKKQRAKTAEANSVRTAFSLFVKICPSRNKVSFHTPSLELKFAYGSRRSVGYTFHLIPVTSPDFSPVCLPYTNASSNNRKSILFQQEDRPVDCPPIS